jgi:hypothetical protein
MATSLKARTMLSLAYGCGLRASAVLRLRASDIDSEQMIIRIVQSKGRKDRHVMLPAEVVTHTIYPSTETVGGNILFDDNKNFHAAWDAPPTNFHVAQALDLLPLAKQVPKDTDPVENWSFAWAIDTIKLEPRAFAGATFARVQPSAAHRDGGWSITFLDHAAYVDARDAIKREQLAKASARANP